jgi:8-demethyl-8-alpha-L-rhamnosyltetracenomycin-C 2'-O-methyltransferase
MEPTMTLLTVAETRDGDVAAAIGDIGVEQAAEAVLAEVVFRARLDELRTPDGATVVLALVHGGERMEFTINDGAGADLPSVVITQDLVECVRALYGPPGMATDGTRTVRWPGAEVVEREYANNPTPRSWAAPVQRILDVLDRRDTATLSRLAVYCGTDKWGPLHQYTPTYESHLRALRDRRLTIVEIGVGGYKDPASGGESLRMWKHYFPRAVIYGLDVVDKHVLDEPRIVTLQVDQSDPDALRAMVRRIGVPDVVIDDGSHISAHVITAFTTLFPLLRDGGLYIVEDLQTSFWPFLFKGSEDDLNDPAYSLAFLKQLVDGLHHQEYLRPDTWKPSPTDQTVRGVHFYHNLAVVEKGPNRDGSPVADALRAGVWTTEPDQP